MKHIILIAVTVVLIAVGVAAGYALGRADEASAPSGTPHAQDGKDTPPAQTEATLTGEMECLPRKDEGGMHDMSCAIGLKADDGKHYALNANDPTLTGSIPTGQRVKATGTLTATSDSKYNIVGTLAVTSIDRL